MKIIVDKMPTKESECVFSTPVDCKWKCALPFVGNCTLLDGCPSLIAWKIRVKVKQAEEDE